MPSVKVIISPCVARRASCEKRMDSRLRGNDNTQHAIGSNKYPERRIASFASLTVILFCVVMTS